MTTLGQSDRVSQSSCEKFKAPPKIHVFGFISENGWCRQHDVSIVVSFAPDAASSDWRASHYERAIQMCLQKPVKAATDRIKRILI